MTTENTEVQPATSGVIANRPRVQQLAEFLGQIADATPTEDRAREVSANQIEQILAVAETEGSTLDDIWDADRGGVVGLRDIVGAVIKIHSISYSRSRDFDADLGVFALLDADMLWDPEKRYPQGSQLVIDTGVGRVITKLRAFEARGAFPLDALVTGIKSANGIVIRLDKAPNIPVVQTPEA